MPATIVEQVFGRVYSKGVRLLTNTAAPPLDPGGAGASALISWLAGFTVVGGVKSIGGPQLSRDILELQELDVGPTTLVGAETPEMFYYKNKAPGDKDIQPIPVMLNMSHQQFQKLFDVYNGDLTVGFMITFPSGALFLGLAFIDGLEPNIESSKIIEIALDLQPAFGVAYQNNCTGYTALASYWANYLPIIAC